MVCRLFNWKTINWNKIGILGMGRIGQKIAKIAVTGNDNSLP